MKKIIKGIFLTALLTSCEFEEKTLLTEEVYPVIVEEYSQNKLLKSDTTSLTVRKNDSVNFNLFGLNREGEYEVIMGFPIEINPNNNSKILINKIPAQLVSEKQFSKENEDLIIRKYFYDSKNNSDEEGNYYVLNNRVVAFKSTVNNLYTLYKYENAEIGNLVESDTTDFFDFAHKIEID